MGGHGGLNILPQKRWNVYNFDNREKVRKDEEEAAEQERQVEEEQRRIDGGIRREKLLAKAREKRERLEQPSAELLGGPDGEAATLPPSVPLEANRTSVSALPSADTPSLHRLSHGESGEQPQVEDLHPGKGHVNLFEEEETRAASGGGAALNAIGSKGTLKGPGAKRGPDADLKQIEDEKYRLGYGASKPWYAQGIQKGQVEDLARTIARPEAEVCDESVSLPRKHQRGDGTRGNMSKDHGHERREKIKEEVTREGERKKRRHASKKDQEKKGHVTRDDQKRKNLEMLRNERLAREAKEKARADKLLAQHGQNTATRLPGTSSALSLDGGMHFGNKRGYNSAFGYGR